MKPDTVLIMSHLKDGSALAPHLTALKHSNPWVDIHVIAEPDTNTKQYHWKNSDMVLRNWWKQNGRWCRGNVIAILEYDTLVEIPLPDLPDSADLVGAQVLRENINKRNQWIPKVTVDPAWAPDNWLWWCEIPLLDLSPNQTAVGLVPFGCMIVRRKFLDRLIEPCWDAVYNKSIQNELRFPSVLKCCGARVEQINLPRVWHTEIKAPGGGTISPLLDAPGIYHPVKTPRKTLDKETSASTPEI